MKHTQSSPNNPSISKI